MRKTIFLIAILNSFLFFRLSISYYLPARSVDDFISLTNATRKNPHEWRTPLINALLSNIEKQMRKACKLSFVNPCDSFSVLFDSSSSHKRAFSLFAILKMGFVALCFSAKWWRFLRDNVTTLSTSLYTPIYRINPRPKTTTYRIVYTFIVLTIIYLIQTYIGFGGREFMRQDHKEDSKRV